MKPVNVEKPQVDQRDLLPLRKRFFETFPIAELVSYGIIGLIGVGLDYSFFIVLHRIFDIAPVIATTVSAIVAGTLTFPLNRHYTFKKTDDPHRRFVLYVGVNLTGIAIGALMMYVGNSLIGIEASIMKGIIVVFVAGIQYLLNKFVAFK